jgi:dienelactone hydrolase
MIRRTLPVWIAVLLGAILSVALFADDGWKSASVRQTFDGRAFDYLEKPLAQRPGYRILRLKYPSPTETAIEQNNTIPADYYLPDGIAPGEPRRPAVICLHILDGNDPLTEILCASLAARGIPALAFKLPYYGERGLPEGPMAIAKAPKLLVSALEQIGGDVRRTVDLLASRPEIDPDKIDIAGISLGGIVAASAAGAEPRIRRAALLLAGADLLTILHSAEETKPLSTTIKALPDADRAAIEEKIKAVDPLRFAAGLRDRAQNGQVLMINAMEDEVIPKRCTEKLADALAIPDKIVWLDGLGHYTSMAELPTSLKTVGDFFARDLPRGVAPPSTDSRTTEMKTLAELFRNAASMLADTPATGKCMSIAVKYSFAPKDRSPLEGEFRLARDSQKHFALSCDLPLIGELSLGQGKYPWITSGNVVLAGTEKPSRTLRDPQELVGKRPLQFVRMWAGLFQTLAQNPEVFMRYIDNIAVSERDGERSLHVLGKGNIFREVTMMFGKSSRTPSIIEIQADAFSGRIQILDWRTDADAQPELFEPPRNVPARKVAERDIYQMFDALRDVLQMAGRK